MESLVSEQPGLATGISQCSESGKISVKFLYQTNFNKQVNNLSHEGQGEYLERDLLIGECLVALQNLQNQQEQEKKQIENDESKDNNLSKMPVPLSYSFDGYTLKILPSDKYISSAMESGTVPLFHSDQRCFNYLFTQQFKNDYTTPLNPLRSYKLAGCVLVQDIEGAFMLTRRHDRMKIFPRAWVIPGGHVDPGESIEQACLRELHEECGINIYKSNESPNDQQQHIWEQQNLPVDCQIFAAFESSSPPKPDNVLPSSGHLIFYVLAKIPVHRSQIEIQFQANEVGAGAWLTQEEMAIVYDRDKEQAGKYTVKGIELDNQNKYQTVDIPIEQFYPFYPNETGAGLSGSARIIIKHLLMEQNQQIQSKKQTSTKLTN